jgi:hypothetical protein
MPLADEIRGLADRILARLDEAREFYVHSRQAWRLVQKLARKGRPIGIIDLATKRPLPTGDLDSRVERYVTVRLAESTFREISTLLEDWILGLIRIWLTAYPEDLDLNFDPATGRRRGPKQEEVQVPLSRLLHLRDCTTILDALIERTVRDMTYERPEKWFRYLDSRVSLGRPDPSERARLYEMKAARDCLEHNRGVINRDHLDKAGTAARFAEGALVRIDEPYLMACFALLRGIIEAMATTATGIASGTKPPRPHHRGGRRGRPSTP